MPDPLQSLLDWNPDPPQAPPPQEPEPLPAPEEASAITKLDAEREPTWLERIGYAFEGLPAAISKIGSDFTPTWGGGEGPGEGKFGYSWEHNPITGIYGAGKDLLEGIGNIASGLIDPLLPGKPIANLLPDLPQDDEHNRHHREFLDLSKAAGFYATPESVRYMAAVDSVLPAIWESAWDGNKDFQTALWERAARRENEIRDRYPGTEGNPLVAHLAMFSDLGLLGVGGALSKVGRLAEEGSALGKVAGAAGRVAEAATQVLDPLQAPIRGGKALAAAAKGSEIGDQAGIFWDKLNRLAMPAIKYAQSTRGWEMAATAGASIMDANRFHFADAARGVIDFGKLFRHGPEVVAESAGRRLERGFKGEVAMAAGLSQDAMVAAYKRTLASELPDGKTVAQHLDMLGQETDPRVLADQTLREQVRVRADHQISFEEEVERERARAINPDAKPRPPSAPFSADPVIEELVRPRTYAKEFRQNFLRDIKGVTGVDGLTFEHLDDFDRVKDMIAEQFHPAYRGMLDDMLRFEKQSGVSIGRFESYYPHSWTQSFQKAFGDALGGLASRLRPQGEKTLKRVGAMNERLGESLDPDDLLRGPLKLEAHDKDAFARKLTAAVGGMSWDDANQLAWSHGVFLTPEQYATLHLAKSEGVILGSRERIDALIAKRQEILGDPSVIRDARTQREVDRKAAGIEPAAEAAGKEAVENLEGRLKGSRLTAAKATAINKKAEAAAAQAMKAEGAEKVGEVDAAWIDREAAEDETHGYSNLEEQLAGQSEDWNAENYQRRLVRTSLERRHSEALHGLADEMERIDARLSDPSITPRTRAILEKNLRKNVTRYKTLRETRSRLADAEHFDTPMGKATLGEAKASAKTARQALADALKPLHKELTETMTDIRAFRTLGQDAGDALKARARELQNKILEIGEGPLANARLQADLDLKFLPARAHLDQLGLDSLAEAAKEEFEIEKELRGLSARHAEMVRTRGGLPTKNALGADDYRAMKAREASGEAQAKEGSGLTPAGAATAKAARRGTKRKVDAAMRKLRKEAGETAAREAALKAAEEAIADGKTPSLAALEREAGPEAAKKLRREAQVERIREGRVSKAEADAAAKDARASGGEGGTELEPEELDFYGERGEEDIAAPPPVRSVAERYLEKLKEHHKERYKTNAARAEAEGHEAAKKFKLAPETEATERKRLTEEVDKAATGDILERLDTLEERAAASGHKAAKEFALPLVRAMRKEVTGRINSLLRKQDRAWQSSHRALQGAFARTIKEVEVAKAHHSETWMKQAIERHRTAKDALDHFEANYHEIARRRVEDARSELTTEQLKAQGRADGIIKEKLAKLDLAKITGKARESAKAAIIKRVEQINLRKSRELTGRVKEAERNLVKFKEKVSTEGYMEPMDILHGIAEKITRGGGGAEATQTALNDWMRRPREGAHRGLRGSVDQINSFFGSLGFQGDAIEKHALYALTGRGGSTARLTGGRRALVHFLDNTTYRASSIEAEVGDVPAWQMLENVGLTPDAAPDLWRWAQDRWVPAGMAKDMEQAVNRFTSPHIAGPVARAVATSIAFLQKHALWWNPNYQLTNFGQGLATNHLLAHIDLNASPEYTKAAVQLLHGSGKAPSELAGSIRLKVNGVLQEFDKEALLRPMMAYDIIPMQGVHTASVKEGVLDDVPHGRGYTEPLTSGRARLAAALNAAPNLANKAANVTLGKVAVQADAYNRVVLALDRFSKGETDWKKIAAEVNKYQPPLDVLSTAERGTGPTSSKIGGLAQWSYFYAWPRHMMPMVVKLALEHPERFSSAIRLGQTAQTLSGGEAAPYEPDKPRWLRESWRLAQNRDDGAESGRRNFRWMPAQDFLRFMEHLEDPYGMVAQLHPIARFAVEHITGREAFRDRLISHANTMPASRGGVMNQLPGLGYRQIEGKPFGMVDPEMYHFWRSIPPVGILMSMLQKGEDHDYSPLGFMSGSTPYTYDRELFQHIMSREDRYTFEEQVIPRIEHLGWVFRDKRGAVHWTKDGAEQAPALRERWVKLTGDKSVSKRR